MTWVAPAAGPAQKFPPKSSNENNSEKTCNGIRKSDPQRSPLGPHLGPKNGNKSEKIRSKKHVEKHGAQSAAQDVSREPLQPSESCFRFHEVIVITFPPSKMSPWAPLWEPFGPRTRHNSSQRAHPQNVKKSMRILMPPGARMDSKITSKWG